MKVYQPLDSKDSTTGLFYKEWDIPDGMPLASSLILIAPPKELKFPKYDPVQGVWVEDKLSVVDDFTKDKEVMEQNISKLEEEKAELKANQQKLYAKLDSAESTILDLADMIFAAQQ